MSDVTAMPALINDEWLAGFLHLATPVAQQAALQDAGLLTPTGLVHLLDYSEGLIHRNPGQARQLAHFCETAAETLAAPTLVPRAQYVRAQSHAINGELTIALALVEAAHNGFSQQGLIGEAMRTNIGRMRVLGELGQFGAALIAGQQVLDWLNQTASVSALLPTDEALTLQALVQTQLGICYGQVGRFQEALAAFSETETVYEALALPAHNAAVKNNRGLILVYLGQAREALVAFAAAAQLQADEELILPQAHTQSNLGEAHLLLGDYRAALAAFEQADRLLADQDALTDRQINLRQMADAYLALNLFDEALATYRMVEPQLAQAGMVHERAWVLWGMGAALVGQEQLTAAATWLTAAADAFATVGNAPLLAGVRLEQAALLERLGDNAGAHQAAQSALDLVRAGDWPLQQFLAHLRLADLAFPAAAIVAEHLTAAQALATTLALPHLRHRLDQRVARLYLLQGRTAEAVTLLEATVMAIETLRNTLPLEPMRRSFLRDKLNVYELLVQLYLAQGDEIGVRRAFALAERARSRTLVERMAGLLETEINTTAAPELADRLRDLQAELHAIYSRLLQQTVGVDAASTAERSAAGTALRESATALEQEINRLQLLVAPQAMALTAQSALSLAATHFAPAGDAIVVAYYFLEEEIIAFVLAGAQVQVVRGLSTRTAIEARLQRLGVQWERFRAGSAFVQRHLVTLHQSTQRILAELYNDLFAPIASLLATLLPATTEPRPLTIVPHALLYRVPFQALSDGEQTLLERYVIAYAPSATALFLLQQRPAAGGGSALVVGVADPGIPAVQQEVQRVAAHLAAPSIQTDDAATVSALLAQLPAAGLLHLACHGIFRADNPMFSALKLTDGWLTAATVAQLRLRCALVVLSACESGRGQSSGGDELLGLARAFLGAGAATLIVSQWMVQDATTAELMDHFYGALAAGHGAATALRLAQLAVKAHSPHPYYWAPFVLLGERSTGLAGYATS
ncbi:MAG: CHAT domain-containing protein [Caldilineaceae bacterium]